MTPEQRTDLLESLDRLADEDDAAALAAARKATELAAAIGKPWDELLVDEATTNGDELAHEEAAPETSQPQTVSETQASTAENKEALQLIEALLSRKNLFEGTRDELLAYKEDIAEGEFQADDLRYLRSLSNRLKKTG